MKKTNLLLLMGTLMFSQVSSANSIDGLEYGVSLMGSKTSTSGEYDVNGVIFAVYDGYEFEMQDSHSVHLVPVGVDVEVNGEKVTAYVDLASYQNYKQNDFQYAISAISIDYNKFNDFSIRKEKKTTILDATATQFYEKGIFDIDISANIGIGGRIKTESVIESSALTAKYTESNPNSAEGTTNFEFNEKHYATAGISAGAEFELTEDINMYFYAGYQRQIGEISDTQINYAGIEFSGLEVSGFEISPTFEYKLTDSEFEDAFKVKENQYRVGVMVRF